MRHKETARNIECNTTQSNDTPNCLQIFQILSPSKLRLSRIILSTDCPIDWVGLIIYFLINSKNPPLFLIITFKWFEGFLRLTKGED